MHLAVGQAGLLVEVGVSRTVGQQNPQAGTLKGRSGKTAQGRIVQKRLPVVRDASGLHPGGQCFDDGADGRLDFAEALHVQQGPDGHRAGLQRVVHPVAGDPLGGNHQAESVVVTGFELIEREVVNALALTVVTYGFRELNNGAGKIAEL